MHRALILPLAGLALLAGACSKGDDAGNNAQAAPPVPKPTGPLPKTPVIANPPVAPGNQASWMEPRDNASDPATAPYGNVLSEPVVQGNTR